MLSRIFGLALVLCGSGYGCGCYEASVEQKRAHAEIIFRGTITELRSTKEDSGISGLARDRKQIAVFRVSRVWKGDVGPVLEMPAVEETSTCVGFWPPLLKVGSDLLVYARRMGAGYVTSICGNHKPAENAPDLKELGPGDEPKVPEPPSKKAKQR